MSKINHKTQKLSWGEPLQIANLISQNYHQDWVFLYSSLNDEIQNSKSIIALHKKNQLILDDLKDLKKYLSDSKNYENSYFGYISYEYKNNLEKYQKTQNSFLNLPKIKLCSFSLILEFDHDKKSLIAYFQDQDKLEELLNFEEKNSENFDIKISQIDSNFSDHQYLKSIEKIKEQIKSGDFYQTNLTRKFYGKISESKPINHFQLFAKLCKISPANFSSFIKFGQDYIISASPELFFQTNQNSIISRPIKGTSPRNQNEKIDKENKEYLLKSDKEKAENLMIVDLVRNDISKICEPGSVKVEKLFTINSYKTLHHLSSEIVGQKDRTKDAIEIFDAVFPPGSMTGAPKIKAIQSALNFEKLNRSVYSGAIGCFKNLEEAIFSVVIRTIIFQKNNFEFQVGGAITYDSNPQKELEEIYVKAKGIAKLLNIDFQANP